MSHNCPGTCGRGAADAAQQEVIARLKARIAELERHLSPPLCWCGGGCDHDDTNGARLVAAAGEAK